MPELGKEIADNRWQHGIPANMRTYEYMRPKKEHTPTLPDQTANRIIQIVNWILIDKQPQGTYRKLCGTCQTTLEKPPHHNKEQHFLPALRISMRDWQFRNGNL
jgi:hypothetical protein